MTQVGLRYRLNRANVPVLEHPQLLYLLVEIDSSESIAGESALPQFCNVTLTLRMVRGVSPRQVWQVLPMISNLDCSPLSDRDAQVHLGELDREQGKSVLVELLLPPRQEGRYRMAQAEVSYDVPAAGIVGEKAKTDIVISFTSDANLSQQYDARVMNLVEKVTAFKLQTRALDEAAAGNIAGATQKLRAAATRLLDMGETELAEIAMAEADRLEQSGQMSAAGTKKLRYETRKLTAKLDAPKGIICPMCGTATSVGGAFCDNCGASLAVAFPAPAAPLAPSPPPPSTPEQPPTPAMPTRPSLPARPEPAHPPTAVPPRKEQSVERYGRIEYRSPMDLEQVYPLRVGLLLKRHGKKLLQGARVRWGRVQFPTEEAEPILTIRPYSPYFAVSPGSRDIKLRQTKDVFARFQVIPERMPTDPGGRCQLRVEFDYQGETVKTIDLDVTIQHKFRLGRWEIPHVYWRPFGIAGSVIVSLDTALNIYQFAVSVPSSPVSLVGFVLALGVGVGLLALGLALWRRASRKEVQRL